MSYKLVKNKTFLKRVDLLNDLNNSQTEKFNEIIIFVDEIENDLKSYSLSSTFFQWLLGEEIHNSTMVFSFDKQSLTIFCNEEKQMRFERLTENNDDISIKTTENSINSIDEYLSNREKNQNDKEIQKATALYIAEENFSEKTKSLLGLFRKFFELEEGSSMIASLMSVNDFENIKRLKKSCELTSAIMKHVAIPEIEKVVDENLTVTHGSVSLKVREALFCPEKVDLEMNKKHIELTKAPIVQSPGFYNLEEDLSKLSSPVPIDIKNSAPILLSLGVRYKNMSSNIARTLLFDPTETQKRAYEGLCDAFDAAKKIFRPGVALCEIWQEVGKTIREKLDNKLSNLSSNCGYGIGIIPENKELEINEKNQNKIESGMAFYLSVGLENLMDEITEINYSLNIADVVLVLNNLTETLTNVPYRIKNISYIKDGENKQEAEEENGSEKVQRTDLKQTDISELINRRRTTRGTSFYFNTLDKDVVKAKHQKILEEKIKKGLKAKQNIRQNTITEKTYIAYDNTTLMPESTNPFKTFVDPKAKTLIIPVSGTFYPVHMSVIKSVQISHLDKMYFLQINFNPPNLKFQEPFIKEITLRSKNQKNFENIVNQTKELKKSLVSDKEKDTEKNIDMDQKEIVLIKDKSKVPRLANLKVRPMLAGKKSSVGVLEAHKNGFLFTLNFSRTRPVKTTILYENIKHAFFQPASNTVSSVLIHFHLHTPVQLSKRTKDVQFYIDIIESSTNVESSIKSDQDGIREEQREIQYKNKMNRVFKEFVKAATKVALLRDDNNLRFDIPYEDLKFDGVPDKSTVSIYPTVDCLISLEEHPPFVLSLSDVEVVHFERVRFELKHFDVVFVLKDLKSYKRVDAVPVKHLEQLRQFFFDANIIFFTGNINLDWDKILKEINSDLKEFWSNGGWKFLDVEQDRNSESETETDEFKSSDFSGDENEDDSFSEDDKESYSEEMEDEITEDEDEDEESDDIIDDLSPKKKKVKK